MEFVGKSVKKDGFLSGIVQSYDVSSGFFKIAYEGGDFEEVDLSQVLSLLAVAEPVELEPNIGRRPKKRRRLDQTSKSDDSDSNSNSIEGEETLGNGKIDLNEGYDDFREIEVSNGNLTNDDKTSVTVDLNEGEIDLNAGFNLNLNEGIIDLNVDSEGINGNVEGNLSKKEDRECIDLNLDANGDVDESSNKDAESIEMRKECGFDLNLGIDEEVKDEEPNGHCEGLGQINESVDRIYNEGEDGPDANGTLQEVDAVDGICNNGIVSSEECQVYDAVNGLDASKEDSPKVINDNQCDVKVNYQEGSGSSGRRRGRRRKIVNAVDNLNSTPEKAVLADAKVVHGNQDDTVKEESVTQTRRRRGRPPSALKSKPVTEATLEAQVVKEDCNVVTNENQVDTESTCNELTGSRRKRRRVSDLHATPETPVLRRSTRRGITKNDVPMSAASSSMNDLSMSPAVSALTEEKPVRACRRERHGQPVVLPEKVQLPPSSRNLDLSGISVIDIFSVYACLRSFSTLLFLSPFELEEFVAALKCNSSSSLFDSIHVSILQALRKHLEYLSNEGFESASKCLRSLNWDFLDLITWPVFIVEYLLLHGSDLKPGLNLSDLKLLKNDYCKQPVSLKIEILRYLCDDMIEVETIRSELLRRLSGTDSDLDFDRNISNGVSKKRRSRMDASAASCSTEDAVDDTSDWNSDECCLCKMDGSLICCDGCPAAFHSKCVGVANDSLPEGDWFCPECSINQHKPWMRTRKSLRGAELLGVDPYGRQYFSSCGYLLVSDSCEPESSFSYYNRDDLNVITEVLRSSEMIYGSILDAILKHWDIPIHLDVASSNLDSLNNGLCVGICEHQAVLAYSETGAAKDDSANERKSGKNHLAGQTCLSSEGSVETTQTSVENQNLKRERRNSANKSAEPMEDGSLTPSCLDLKNDSVVKSADNCHPSSALNETNRDLSQVLPGTGYLNYYSFGHIASFVGEDLLRKSADKTMEVIVKPDEEIISSQMKIMSKKCSRFHWPSIPRLGANVQKEKCGWCFSCRSSSDDPGCLFNMSVSPVGEGFVSELFGLQSKRTKAGHLIDVISYVLMVEDRLQGLLLGPWLNAHYSKIWRKSALKASDIASIKRLLFTLESNISHLAISAEWLKHVDSSPTIGSATHIVIASSRASKNGIGKKRTRTLEGDSNPSSNPSSGLTMLWWRGGRVSRRLFSWKVVPRSLACKAARRAGCMKIPGMLYPENSDFAKRTKNIAWRAAVESSTTVEQLALQVREFDSNIKWDAILNTNPLSVVDKDSKKSIRLFKKVIIRRKCVEIEGTKYLLDFGKRRCIPEVVLKNGSVVEESSSERKKYWLSESYVPLYILRNFEEKRIARRSSKTSSGKPSDAGLIMKKSTRKRGFSYLFAKAERSEYHQCGHCNKDVPIREAVCCQYCQGSFHKRHARKSAGSIAAQCKYTCHRCFGGKHSKVDSKMGKRDAKKGKMKNMGTKTEQQKSKKSTVSSSSVPFKNSKKPLRSSKSSKSKKNKKVTVVVPLRRSPRKAKLIALQSKKVRGRKKGKPGRPKKATAKRSTKVISMHKKRTQAYHSYWLNGLRLTRKPEDERVMHFRRKRFLAPSESVIQNQPKCHLCLEAGYTSTSNYISCEKCGEWFHGDAFGLDVENVDRLIGFRCHTCRNSKTPLCPFVSLTKTHESDMDASENDVTNEDPVEETIFAQCPTQRYLSQESPTDKDPDSPLPADRSANGEDGTVPMSGLEIGSEDLLDNVKEHPNKIQISREDLNAESISCNGNGAVDKDTIELELDAIVTSHDQMQPPICSVGSVGVTETESTGLGCENASHQ